jgi:hypothetical protein
LFQLPGRRAYLKLHPFWNHKTHKIAQKLYRLKLCRELCRSGFWFNHIEHKDRKDQQLHGLFCNLVQAAFSVFSAFFAVKILNPINPVNPVKKLPHRLFPGIFTLARRSFCEAG